MEDHWETPKDLPPGSGFTGWGPAADRAIVTELNESAFMSTFFASDYTHFWVAESDDPAEGVVGSVGVKRHSQDEGELVRMAVSPRCRGGGIGAKLITELVSFCVAAGVCRIHLTTANPQAANFYKKHDWVVASQAQFSPIPGTKMLDVFKMVKYIGSRLFDRVTIIGGTHGNERIGIELVRQWAADPSLVARRTLTVQALISNERAASLNRRYIDTDLNRQFLGDAFSSEKPRDSYEEQRAAELNQMLGPKGEINSANRGTDFVIDLHSSSSNFGVAAMISSMDNDVMAQRIALHLQETMGPDFKVTSSPGSKKDSWSIDSIPASGLAFEVGPLTHGTLELGLLDETRRLVFATLDFIDAHNQALISAAAVALGKSFEEISESKEGFLNIQGRYILPASLSPNAVCRTEWPELNYYVMDSTVVYPTGDASVESPAQSPAGVTNNAFDKFACKGYVVHPSLTTSSWPTIKEGDPAFVSTDGRGTIVPLSRPSAAPSVSSGPAPPSSTSEWKAVFVNEAAYQESGTGFALYKSAKRFVA
jgi:succinylglutamate desuccinylase/GNAT superfamily N-acetyltransferase